MKTATLIIAALLLLTACTPSAGPNNSQSIAPTATVNPVGIVMIPDIDPCTLLDELTVARFFGVKPHPGNKLVGTKGASCTFTSESGGDSMIVNVLLVGGTAKDSADYTSAKTAKTTPITGLGDDAYFNKTSSLLTAAKGPWIVMLSGSQKGKKADSVSLTRPMQLVVGRLPH